MGNGAVLITGGAGYIGSHVVRQLGEAGETVVVLDDLSTGTEAAILYGEFVRGDCGDRAAVERILAEYQVTAVLHFAARTIVPESVADPLRYYLANTCKTRNLLDACQRAGVAHFVFSSTAAVYGVSDNELIDEDAPLRPINPYGTSKLMSEWMLRDLAAASALRHVTLRYFNVAGADPGGRIGQSTPKATLLTKVACEAAVGRRPYVAVYGSDYPTPDGTGVRDYIHVEDLAHAHVRALEYLRQGGDSATLNCGYGRGYSVREVLDTVRRISGSDFEVREETRRAGDPAALVADASRLRELLQWTPQYDNLDVIVRTALDWERRQA